jgi:hypothetical protein
VARQKTSFGSAFALAIAATYACSDYDDNPFRRDVLTCEEAVARLARCCDPSFDAERVACAYSWEREERGCNGPTTTTVIEPALSTTESTCVLEMECEALVASGTCNRAEAAFPYRKVSFSGSSGSPGLFGGDSRYEPGWKTDDAPSHRRVCP